MTTTATEMVRVANARIGHVTPAQARGEIASGIATVLDVREPVEWEQHIAGAVQIPRGLLEFAADPGSPRHNPALDPDARVIVYCRSGVRSALAAQTLQELGFTDVANLDGGFTAWKDAGLPLAEHHEGI